MYMHEECSPQSKTGNSYCDTEMYLQSSRTVAKIHSVTLNNVVG